MLYDSLVYYTAFSEGHYEGLGYLVFFTNFDGTSETVYEDIKADARDRFTSKYGEAPDVETEYTLIRSTKRLAEQH